MSQEQSLRDSHGPEATPYQHSYPQPPESCYEAPPHLRDKQNGHTELVQVPATTEPRTRYCGISKKAFWLFVALAVAISLGLGIGLGVGLGIDRKRDNDHASSEPLTTSHTTVSSVGSTSTSTIAPVTSGVQGLAANSCTFKDPRTYRARGGATFVEYCFTDWPNGVAASNGRGKVKDLKYTIAYTFEACMEDCVEYNDSGGTSGVRCFAVTYNSNLTSAISGQGGNCFLKDSKGIEVQASDMSASAALVL